MARALENRGLNVWWDARIAPGMRWRDEIKRELNRANAVVVLVTPSSLESQWVGQEWSEALSRSRLVIPAVAGGLSLSDLPEPLAHIQGILFDPDNPSSSDALVRSIRDTSASVGRRPADVIDVDKIVKMVVEQALQQLKVASSAPNSNDLTDSSLIFAVMSFAPDMEPTFEAIEAAAKAVGLRAERVKDVPGDYRITEQILRMIRDSRFVVADLTHERPNVYFELGYARGIGKTVVTIIKQGSKAHFDVHDWTFLEYSDSRPLERELVKRFKYELERVLW